ncbi:hypothetical protein ANCCAN_18640 [Ancylostoma caninum]|uniref:Uncharacterized protein n=1 Tax=Ancylostoma caninum TaxID=29170 RepID=A0A368FTH8_ANCCA|nr:hypothetical protein ANCCAN_18640 [Ancylostoma caninum]
MADLSNKNAKMNSLLNRKRKVDMGAQPVVEASPGPSQDAECAEAAERNEPESEEERRKAVDALLRECKRAKERAEMVGPQGWLRPKSLNTNKQFLHRTLAATLPERRRKQQRSLSLAADTRDSRPSTKQN